MGWKEKAYDKFFEADYLKAGSQKSYFGGGLHASQERMKDFLKQELQFHLDMLESDKRDKYNKSEVSFREGIISQTKSMLHYLADEQ